MLDQRTRIRLIRAAETVRERGLTQMEIAQALNASQPQVSRILSGKATRPSRLMEEVCLYVERTAGGVTAEAVRNNDELIDAVRSVWNGSATHARALAAVIRSMALLR